MRTYCIMMDATMAVRMLLAEHRTELRLDEYDEGKAVFSEARGNGRFRFDEVDEDAAMSAVDDVNERCNALPNAFALNASTVMPRPNQDTSSLVERVRNCLQTGHDSNQLHVFEVGKKAWTNLPDESAEALAFLLGN